MINHVIFDLDGTLLDTREGILESVRYTAKTLGYEELPRETLLKFVGPPIQQSLMTYYGCDAQTAQEGANLFREYYKTTALLKAEPYDGIYECCRVLKDHKIKMAVATYKREDYALTLLKHFHFDEYCDPMHGADNFNVLKKEDIVRMCMEEMGGSEDDSVLVGDTLHDAKGALQAGTPFIAVTYGFGLHTDKELNQYPHISVAKTPLEIVKAVL